MGKYSIEKIGKYQKLAEHIMKEKPAVVLYGFNEAGKKAYKMLKSKGVSVKKILDIVQSKTHKMYDDVPIVSPNEFIDYIEDDIYILCSNRYFDEMKRFLHQKGCKKILPYYAVYYDVEFTYKEFLDIFMIARRAESNEYLDHSSIRERQCIIDTLDLVITECCSLRCRECSNLMQYFQEPKHADRKRTMQAMKKLLSVVDYIHEIRILGGEPFVNKEWDCYVRELLPYHNIGNVVLYTNGTIFPATKQMEVFSDRRVVLSISDYGHLSRKKEQLIAFMEQGEYFYHVGKVTKWIRCSTISPYQRTEEELKEMYHICCVSGCLSLKNDKLFACPFAGSVYALQAIPEAENEFVDLSQTNPVCLRNMIRKLQEKPYLRACNYCEGRPIGVVNISAAEQCDAPRGYLRYNYDDGGNI